MKSENKGLLMLVIAAFLWGSSAVFAKYVFGSTPKISPFIIAQVRITLSALICALVFLCIDRKVYRIERADLYFFIIYGFSIFTMQLSLYYAISRLNVGIATFLQSFSTILIFIYSVLYEKEKVSLYKIWAVVLGILGLTAILGEQMQSLNGNWKGILVGLISALGVTFYVIYGKNGLKKYSAFTAFMYAQIFGALFSWFIVPPWTVFKLGFGVREWGYCLYMAIFATILPFLFNMKGIILSATSTSSVLLSLDSFIATVFAFIILGEVLTPMQALGVLAMFLGIILIQCDIKNKHSFSTSGDSDVKQMKM